MRIALCQFDPIVGDIAGNKVRIIEFISQARTKRADLAVFCELAVVGYPPRDLLTKSGFVSDSMIAVEEIAKECDNIAALVGYVKQSSSGVGIGVENACALLADGKIQSVHVKSLLPTYDVFDESRYFSPVSPADNGIIEFAGEKIGITICEDLWDARSLGRDIYNADPVGKLASAGAKIIINLAASPYEMHKAVLREELFSRQARRSKASIVYVNQVGGNDELVFDGGSCVIDPSGDLRGRAKRFAEDMIVVDFDNLPKLAPKLAENIAESLSALGEAIKLGLRDYVRKCGFNKVVLGLSGGIDSALVATLAADALGSENVLSLAMPSRYSSDHSIRDAEQLAKNLSIECRTIPIEKMHLAYEKAMPSTLTKPENQLAAENIQARIRGNIIMALSNSDGYLPLATGNKSELSVGYCTLYGDMAGGLAPIGDVPKLLVYQLAEQINKDARYDRIPISTISKPPSAELKPGQVDQDSLPPYEILDEILNLYIKDNKAIDEIIALGFDKQIVTRIAGMIDRTEYKRRQAPPVLKVTAKAFGTGRRMPIAQNYKPREF